MWKYEKHSIALLCLSSVKLNNLFDSLPWAFLETSDPHCPPCWTGVCRMTQAPAYKTTRAKVFFNCQQKLPHPELGLASDWIFICSAMGSLSCFEQQQVEKSNWCGKFKLASIKVRSGLHTKIKGFEKLVICKKHEQGGLGERSRTCQRKEVILCVTHLSGCELFGLRDDKWG